MRLWIHHQVNRELSLPISYHQIIQGIIYHNIINSHGYSQFVHDMGYQEKERQFRMFTFSILEGKYRIVGKNIIFYEDVSFQISSPEVYMLHILSEKLKREGISYGSQYYDDVEVYAADATVESDEIVIRMQSPVCVYETDRDTKKTYFYSPDEEMFAKAVNQNFKRKYKAYYGISPKSGVEIIPQEVSKKDKYVTKYKGFILSGWKGIYLLRGERKYLDFLLQTGLGSKNSQGFGMFEEVIK